MESDYADSPIRWNPIEEIMLLVARELEWAEAYVSENPTAEMGKAYLHALQCEMVTLSERM
jgi:hypothetical protein